MIHSFNTLSSPHNPRIKNLIKLRERSERDLQNRFLIEGYRELLRGVDSSFPIEQLFICSDFFLGTNEEALIERIASQGAELFSCSPALFKKISYRDRPDGLLAIAPQIHRTLSDLEKILKHASSPFLVIAEAIEKPGNLGTILRSSDAVGADALIVCDRCTDVYNPNTVRASVGTLFSVPIIETGSQEALEWLKRQGITIVASTPAATEEFTAVNLAGAVAIAMGTEQLGLSQQWLDKADLQVRIPMKGMADSLNVAMATTLLLYEVLRQRTSE